MGFFSDRDSIEEPDATAELKRMGRDVHSALAELKSAIESKNSVTERRVREWFEKYENENQKLVREHAAYKKAQDEENLILRHQLQEIREANISHKGGLDWSNPASASRTTPEYKTFFEFLKKGREEPGLDFKTLRTDAESQGGYLIPQVLDARIRKNIIEISPIRAHARVRTAPSKTMDVPRRLSIPIAQFEGETEEAPTDQAAYGSEQVTLYRQTVNVPATLDMLVSSAYDLEAEIASDVGESFAQGEGKNFVSGNGRKSPQGIVSDSRVVSYTSSTSAAIVWNDFPLMAGQLKRGMQPWWFMNRKTVAYMQGIQSQIGVPIWQPVAGNQPATIYGYPYDSGVIDLDDVSSGSGAKPVVFADLTRGYEIFDMVGINVVRDDLTQAKQAIVQWIFRRYLTGRVIVPEAIAVMTLK